MKSKTLFQLIYNKKINLNINPIFNINHLKIIKKKINFYIKK